MPLAISALVHITCYLETQRCTVSPRFLPGWRLGAGLGELPLYNAVCRPTPPVRWWDRGRILGSKALGCGATDHFAVRHFSAECGSRISR